ncbi:MAG: hypothetical protein WCA00_14780, partial [Candidatus Acidiferrales bacterium]
QCPHTSFLQLRQAPGTELGIYRGIVVSGLVASIFFAFFKVFFAIFLFPLFDSPCWASPSLYATQ